MNSDNYKLKKTLREDAQLPAGFEWEQMQEGIHQKMDRQSPPDSRTGFPNIWKKWTAFVLVIAATASIAYYLGRQSEKPASNFHSTFSSTPIVTAPATPALGVHTASGIEHPKGTEITAPTTQNRQTNAQSNNTSQLTEVSQPTLALTYQMPQAWANESPLISSESKLPGNEINAASATPAVKQNNDLSPSASRELESDNSNKFSSSLPNNASSQVELNQRATEKNKDSKAKSDEIFHLASIESREIKAVFNRKESLTSLTITIPAQHKSIPTRTWFVAIKGGVSLLNPSFTTTSGQETYPSLESAVPSYTFGIGVGRKIGRSFSISTGMEYTKYWHRFDFVKETIKEVSINNVPITVHVNAISGDSTYYYGDTLGIVRNIRTIRHYNQINVVSIPLMLGYHKKFGKWTAIASAGTSVQWNTKSAGRTFIGSDLVTYGDSTQIHNKFLGLSLQTELGASYDLNDQLEVMANFSAQKSLSNWSSLSTTQWKPWIMGCHLGLRYKF